MKRTKKEMEKILSTVIIIETEAGMIYTKVPLEALYWVLCFGRKSIEIVPHMYMRIDRSPCGDRI
jgi:hypothetical protein